MESLAVHFAHICCICLYSGGWNCSCWDSGRGSCCKRTDRPLTQLKPALLTGTDLCTKRPGQFLAHLKQQQAPSTGIMTWSYAQGWQSQHVMKRPSAGSHRRLHGRARANPGTPAGTVSNQHRHCDLEMCAGLKIPKWCEAAVCWQPRISARKARAKCGTPAGTESNQHRISGSRLIALDQQSQNGVRAPKLLTAGLWQIAGTSCMEC